MFEPNLNMFIDICEVCPPYKRISLHNIYESIVLLEFCIDIPVRHLANVYAGLQTGTNSEDWASDSINNSLVKSLPTGLRI